MSLQNNNIESLHLSYDNNTYKVNKIIKTQYEQVIYIHIFLAK